jgi:TolA-binding protein
LLVAVAVVSGGAGQNNDPGTALLNNAKKAYADKNFPAAAKTYRDFLAKFADHKDAVTARYGLALCLLEEPNPDHLEAGKLLQALVGGKDLPDRAFVHYNLGVALRGLGRGEQLQTVADPAQAAAHQTVAAQHFTDAGKQFALAAAAFAERAKKDPAGTLSSDGELALQARCDQADMLLQTGKIKETQALLAALLKEPLLAKSRCQKLALYQDGVARFLQKDYLGAGRSLSLVTPFTNPEYGVHARYLLARVHQLNDERAEAVAHYDAALAEYEGQKRAAVESLKQPQLLKDPREKVRLVALVREPAPEYVGRARFHLGVLQFEAGRFGEAQGQLQAFLKEQPKSALLPEAQLFNGASQVQLKQYPEAVRSLQPLAEKDTALSDQALHWIGRAQSGAADPNNPKTFEPAVETLRRAAAKTQERAANEPAAKTRLGAILMDLADALQSARNYKEAAATYERILASKSLPQRDEEVVQRLAAALNLAGDYSGSDKICAQFARDYPKSSLLPAILFRQAENAGFRLQTAEKTANPQELDKLREEALKRYQTLVDKFPDFPYAAQARYQIALMHYRKNDLEKAKDVLEAIPAPDRNGDLAIVPYLAADCLIRLTPLKADDALAAGRVQEQLQAARDLLEAFVGGQPKGAPLAGDALIKQGYCHQRLAALLAQPQERAQGLVAARTIYKRIYQEFPNRPPHAIALFEEAKCFIQLGAIPRAMQNFGRFNAEPFKQAPIAPMAFLELATLLRRQNKSAEAAAILAQCRQDHEANMLKDPARAGWAPRIQYQLGLSLQEAGKVPEARGVFDSLIKQFPESPEAGLTAVAWAQSLKDEGLQKSDRNRQRLQAADIKGEEVAATLKALDDDLKPVREAIQLLERHEEQLKKKQPAAEVRASLLYEAAWGQRVLAESEIAAARYQTLQGQPKGPDAAKKPVWLTQVPLAKVPLQASEKKAQAAYQSLIAGFADLPLANNARLELGELLAERGQTDAAIKLFNEALDKEPAPELTDLIRLRLGVALAAKGNAQGALAHFDGVAKRDPKQPARPAAAAAHCLAGEALMQAGDWQGAVNRLAVFRDQPPFHNVPRWSDRGLYRLGQAYAQLKQWDQSRQGFQHLLGRFGGSPWAPDAAYGMGWAWLEQKNYENAAQAFAQAANFATPAAAKAQLQAGLCRLEQKRYQDAVNLLVAVPARFEDADLAGAALVEAARAQIELKQKEPAEKLLQQIGKDYPKSPWADVAKEQLKAVVEGKPLTRPERLAKAGYLAPELALAVGVPALGQPQRERSGLDDATAAVSLAAALMTQVPERNSPAPFVKLNLPDPFEFRLSVPARLSQADQQLPLLAPRGPAS